MEKQKLLFHQARLASRGVAEMVLLHISACKGVPSEMVMTTLELGIAVLRGGNVDIQMGMLNHLKEKKDVGFFTSIAGLMNSCSVLDLDAFERNTKAEGMITTIVGVVMWISMSSSISSMIDDLLWKVNPNLLIFSNLGLSEMHELFVLHSK